MDSNKSENKPDKTPYEILGVKEGADFEDIQKARDIKVKEAGEDLLLKARIESSFDQLLMGSLKARQSGSVSFEAQNASKKEKQFNKLINNDFPLLSKIKNLRSKKKFTISLAESCTGGMISKYLTSINSSALL